MPGNASGGMDGIAIKPLTIDFHEGGFLSKLNQENGLGFWLQLSDKEKEQAGNPWGPANAQALNRYSYVQNNIAHVGEQEALVGPKGSNVYQVKGEYIPPGLNRSERNKFREAVHRYKRTWGLRANQNIPRDIMDQIADAVQNGESADDAADMAESPPEDD